MIKYRPHRGGLAEAMKEVREFDTEEDLKAFVAKQWNDGYPVELFTAEDLVLGDVLGDDPRIGWKNVRHLCVKRMGKDVYDVPQCIGWCGE